MVLLLLAAYGALGQGPQTWLDRPLVGSKHPPVPITILAHASDADGVTEGRAQLKVTATGTTGPFNGSDSIRVRRGYPLNRSIGLEIAPNARAGG